MNFNSPQVQFSKKDCIKLKRIVNNTRSLNIVSTVCPDYPHDGKRYTFSGELGSGIGLIANKHLVSSRHLLTFLESLGATANYLILTADLPELTEFQREFYERVAGSKQEYLNRCHHSSLEIGKMLIHGSSKTFSSFYSEKGVDYLNIQQRTMENILNEFNTNPFFQDKFRRFMNSRRPLAEKFRGKTLSERELKIAAAHGMSLYATHGTLLRHLFPENLIILNHNTANKNNFFSYEFVPGYNHLKNKPKFPVRIIPGDFYK